MRKFRGIHLWITTGCLVFLSHLSSAVAASQDGAYGRLDGDLTWGIGLSSGISANGPRGFVSVDTRLRYFESVGLYVQYDEFDLLKGASTQGQWMRAFGAGVEFRPLFPVRFLKNMESGRAWSDLVLDSLAIEMGAHFPKIYDQREQSAGFSFGFAVEIPLQMKASGFWLRLASSLRWSSLRLAARDESAFGQGVLFSLGIAYHHSMQVGLVDAKDKRLE